MLWDKTDQKVVYMMSFGERIALLRSKKKLTQEQLAKKLGITRAALAKYENNTREPDFETVKRFANFFEVSIDYLVGRAPFSDVVDIKEALENKKRKATWGGEELTEEQKEMLKAIFGPIRDRLREKKEVTTTNENDQDNHILLG